MFFVYHMILPSLAAQCTPRIKDILMEEAQELLLKFSYLLLEKYIEVKGGDSKLTSALASL